MIRAARRLTAEHGLAGFTAEQLADDADISRRTFFNYFASKEDAVLGLPIHRPESDAIERFLAHEGGDDGALSPTLLADLAILHEARWRTLDIAPDTVAQLIAAVEREPRLLGRMLELAIEGEQFDAQLVERREHLKPGDLRAQAASQIVGAIARAATGEFMQPGNTDSFLDIFERRVAAARALFASQDSLIGLR
ncbi:MAG: helix-turn-helix domain-containing protein [Microbacterium sp.]